MTLTTRRPEDERPSLAWLFIALLSILLLFVLVSVAVAGSSRPAHHAPEEQHSVPHDEGHDESPSPGESHAPGSSPVETPHGVKVWFPAA